MKARIAQKKLLFVNKIMKKDFTCIARTTLLQEVLNKIEGLGHECRKIATNVGLPNLMCIQTSKNEIKRAIKNHDREEIRQKVENSTKVGNRITDNPEDCSYLNKMPLYNARLWIQVRAYIMQ